ncbi:LysR family transcriptional regulator [Cupriavidus necator]|jgi:DNA-binding transcriptional LysR family regulator|uniref:LysR family transcriptional regulator n=1 Tax=Cupriavidus necator TaxID=106590 RepID=UPI0005B4DC11|nr:LysR family transcriptional regulator [Cupriavidus necator]
MRLTLQQIETFYWVARLGGFHAAARHQHLTQPTISARIQELEAQLGVELFERERGRSGLTAVGRDALAQAEEIVKLADAFARIATQRDPMLGLLRLGANESTALGGLTELLTQLKTAYRELNIEITVDVGVELTRRLISRELDVAILNESSSSRHVREHTIGLSNLHWIASPKLIRQREITPAALASLPIITVSAPSSNHTLVMNWFRDAGIEPTNISSSNSLSTMIQLVAAGHGVAVMSPAIMKDKISSRLIHTLHTTPRLRQQEYLVAYQNERRGSGMDTIIRLTTEVLTRTGVIISRSVK